MSCPDILIRQAGPQDAADLAAVGTTSFRAAYEATASARDLLAHLGANFGVAAVEEELGASSVAYLLAFLSDRPAGFVKIRASDIPQAVPADGALELQQVYVLPEFQRSGLGGRLIAAAEAYARDRSAHGLWLSVWQEAHWAINAYEKHGFQVVGKTEFTLGSTVYNDFLMWRSIE